MLAPMMAVIDIGARGYLDRRGCRHEWELSDGECGQVRMVMYHGDDVEMIDINCRLLTVGARTKAAMSG
jgi:hypothetical protein